MITVNCDTCGDELKRSPSKVNARNYCSHKCYGVIRNKELMEVGLNTRINSSYSRKYATKRVANMRREERHHRWLGQDASYRAVHYWVRRRKGSPDTCTVCGISDNRPRRIQWANMDGKYRRNLDDFVAMCVSCHKKHDLAIATSAS